MGWTKTRSDIALTLKADPSADVTELRRQLKAERLADYIERVVDEAPALSAEQRDVLALKLRPACTEPAVRWVLRPTGTDQGGGGHD